MSKLKTARKFGASLVLGVATVALSSLATGVGVSAAYAQDKPPQVPQTATQQIPVAEFVKAPNMRTARISPDGKHLAYFAGADGREVLVVLDLDNPKAGPKPIIAVEEARESGDRSVVSYRWIGNDNIVMTVQMREDFGSGPGDFSRLLAYNINTGKTTQQAWRDAGGGASRILYIDHDKGEYLLERDTVAGSTERWGLPEVVRVNVADGKFKQVQRTNPVVGQWAADSDGVIRAGFGSDSKNGKVRMMYRSKDGDNFKTVYNEADKTFTEDLPAPEHFIPGTDDAYVTSRKDGYSKVYRLNLPTMTLSEPVFETEGFDVQGIIENDERDKVLGYVTFDGNLAPEYTDGTLKAIQG